MWLESFGDRLPWAEHTLSAAVAFDSVKGKHLLLTDYIWQAYVSDTSAPVIFQTLAEKKPSAAELLHHCLNVVHLPWISLGHEKHVWD